MIFVIQWKDVVRVTVMFSTIVKRYNGVRLNVAFSVIVKGMV